MRLPVVGFRIPISLALSHVSFSLSLSLSLRPLAELSGANEIHGDSHPIPAGRGQGARVQPGAQ
jgi:hypothetical protein